MVLFSYARAEHSLRQPLLALQILPKQWVPANRTGTGADGLPHAAGGLVGLYLRYHFPSTNRR